MKAIWEAGGCATLGCRVAQLWDPFPWYLQELIRGNKTHFKTLNCPNWKRIQSYHYWTHHDLSPLPSSQVPSIISTQEGFEQETFIFKPLCQPQFQRGLNPSHLNQHQHFSPFTLSVFVISRPKYDRGRWTKNNLEMRHNSLRCWTARKWPKCGFFSPCPRRKNH